MIMKMWDDDRIMQDVGTTNICIWFNHSAQQLRTQKPHGMPLLQYQTIISTPLAQASFGPHRSTSRCSSSEASASPPKCPVAPIFRVWLWPHSDCDDCDWLVPRGISREKVTATSKGPSSLPNSCVAISNSSWWHHVIRMVGPGWSSVWRRDELPSCQVVAGSVGSIHPSRDA